MMNRATAHPPAPQGRGTATLILIGGLLLIALAIFLAMQPGGVLQNMAPLVWWSILGFLGLMGAVMLWGGSLLLRTLSSLNSTLRDHASAFMESAHGAFGGGGLSLNSFDEHRSPAPAPIGVAGLQPQPLAGANADDEARAQFTDSQLSADRGFRASEPGAMGGPSGPAPHAAGHGAASLRPSGNFPSDEATSASQFGALPTMPAAFQARPSTEDFGHRAEAGDAATDFWTPALRAADLTRFTALIDRLFTQAGFVTQSQALSSPGLAAIWLFSRSQPGSPVSLVLCEHGSADGLHAGRLEELRDVMATHQIRRGQFASTANATPALMGLATRYGINLLDIPHLLATVSRRKAEQQGDLWHILNGER